LTFESFPLTFPHSKLSIQNNVIDLSKNDKKLGNLKPKTVAFGRTLPMSLRKNKFNEELFDYLHQTACPPELCSLSIVFQSILHLRSTRALVKHLTKHPELPRARFLQEHKMFDDATLWDEDGEKKPLWYYYYNQ